MRRQDGAGDGDELRSPGSPARRAAPRAHEPRNARAPSASTVVARGAGPRGQGKVEPRKFRPCSSPVRRRRPRGCVSSRLSPAPAPRWVASSAEPEPVGVRGTSRAISRNVLGDAAVVRPPARMASESSFAGTGTATAAGDARRGRVVRRRRRRRRRGVGDARRRLGRGRQHRAGRRADSGGSPFCAAHRRAHFFLQRFRRRSAADVTHLAGNSSRSARHSAAALMCSKTRSYAAHGHVPSTGWPEHMCSSSVALARPITFKLKGYLPSGVHTLPPKLVSLLAFIDYFAKAEIPNPAFFMHQ